MHRMPVMRDDQSFQDRTERMFRDMQQKMGLHHDPLVSTSTSSSAWPSSDWHHPKFLELWPTTSQSGVTQMHQQPTLETLDDATMKSCFVDVDPTGPGGQGRGRLFRMSFDMRQYDPADINVRSENDCLVVEAKHVEDAAAGGMSSTVRQFCRKIQLPSGIDPTKLSSTLSADHILTVQAPVPPDYRAIQAATGGPGCGNSSSQLMTSSSTQQQLQAPVGGAFGRSPSPSRLSGAGGLHQGLMMSPASSLLHSSPMTSMSSMSSLDMPVFVTDPATGRRRLELSIDLGPPFAPGDVAVRLEGRRLAIEAKHENRDGGRVSTSSTQRHFDLAEDVEPSTVTATFRDDGKLLIEGSVKQ